MLGRHGATRPRRGDAGAAVVNEREALALGVIEVEDEPPVALSDVPMRHALRRQALDPPSEARFARNPQRGSNDAVRAAALATDRPIKEGKVAPGRAFPIGVEKMIGADIVLVDRALHQPHAEHTGVEAVIAGCVGGNRRQMVDAAELGRRLFPVRHVRSS